MRIFLAISLLWIFAGCGEVDTKTLKELNQPVDVSTKDELNVTTSKVVLLQQVRDQDTDVKLEINTTKRSSVEKEVEDHTITEKKALEEAEIKSVTDSHFTFEKTFTNPVPKVAVKFVEVNKSIQEVKDQNTSKVIPITTSVDKNQTSVLPIQPVQQSEKYGKSELAYQEQQHKYELALKEIQQKIELAQMDKELKSEIAKYEKEKSEILKEQAIHQANTQIQSQVEMAKYSMESVKAQEATKQLIESQNHNLALETQKQEMELATKEVARDEALEKERLALYKIVAIVVGIVIVLFLLIFYFLRKRAEEKQLKMQENELSQQLQIKMIEQQGRNIEKMLEIVASGKELPKNVEKELLGTIKESQKKTLIFEEKPRRSLIFRK